MIRVSANERIRWIWIVFSKWPRASSVIYGKRCSIWKTFRVSKTGDWRLHKSITVLNHDWPYPTDVVRNGNLMKTEVWHIHIETGSKSRLYFPKANAYGRIIYGTMNISVTEYLQLLLTMILFDVAFNGIFPICSSLFDLSETVLQKYHSGNRSVRGRYISWNNDNHKVRSVCGLQTK